MLNTYRKCVRYTLDGELIMGGNADWVIEDEDKAINSQEEWCGRDNIQEAVINKLGIPYAYTIFRKAFCILALGFAKLKVRNNSVLTKTIVYIQTDASLDELFKMHDSKKVIEYMK